MRKTLSALALFGVLGAGFCGLASGLTTAVQNEKCPIMPGSRIREKFFVDYEGVRVYLCCRSCVKAFRKHPERYLHRLPSGLMEKPE